MRIRLLGSYVNFRCGAIYLLYCSVVTVEALSDSHKLLSMVSMSSLTFTDSISQNCLARTLCFLKKQKCSDLIIFVPVLEKLTFISKCIYLVAT